VDTTPSGDRRAALCTFDRPGGDGGCDAVGVVLRLGLQRQEPSKVALDRRAVRARLTEQDVDLVVVLACGSLTETGAAHGVG
jgi:hypothetical protein